MKKNMKRIIAWFTILVLMITVMPAEVFATQSRSQNFSQDYTLTGDGVNDICNVALAQYQKTGEELGYTEDWCANFVSDCAKLADLSSIIPAHGGVSSLYQNIVNAGGSIVTSPQVGDIAFIDWNKNGGYGHVEIVYQVSDSTVYTIGGNSGPDTSSLYVAQVWKHSLSLNSGYFTKFVRPDYPEVSAPSEPTISNYNVPDVLAAGDIFSIKGTISCGQTITDVMVGCYDVDGNAKTSANANPNSKSYDIKKLDDYIEFNILTAGVYQYKVTATTSAGTTVLIQVPFIVLANEETIPTGTYTMMPYANTSYSVGIQDNSNDSYANVELQSKQSSKYQALYIKYVGDGYYNVRFVGSGLNMEVADSEATANTNIWQNTPDTSDCQKFQILAAGDSYCIIPEIATDLCVDICDGSFDAGTNIQLYTRTLSNTQRFVLEEIKDNFIEGNKINFNTQEGELEGSFISHNVSGYNKERLDDELVVYNVSSTIVDTDMNGEEVSVNSNGLVEAKRTYDDEDKLAVPTDGMVVSEENADNFISSISIGDYVGCDYENDIVYAYENYAAYLKDNKYVSEGEKYGDLPIPEREGYTFRGWFTEETGGEQITEETIYSTSELYAQWTGNDSEVTVNPFVDIEESDYYYDAVLWAYENGITAGKDETHFAPNENCSRAQVVTFLWRAQGCPEPKITENPFVDISSSSYYYKAVLWAYENGITAGKDETHFQPDAIVTRSQCVTFLWRAEGQQKPTGENPFVDVPEGAYYTDAVLWAYENGITTGKDEEHFLPDQSCIRAQVVTFLFRTYN